MRALHTAATGMMAQELNVQVISNNIANMRTTGYKRQRAEFQDLLYEHVRRVGTQTSTQGNILPVGIDLGGGVKTVGTPRLMTQGTISPTGGDLNVAIRGEGFFKVLMPDGTFSYTRDGSFQMDAQGRIVTAQGNVMQPGITIPQQRAVGHHQPAGPGLGDAARPDPPSVLGQLALTRFINKAGLQAIGDNLFVETPASGTPQDGVPNADGMRRPAAGQPRTGQRRGGHRNLRPDRRAARLRDERQGHHRRRPDAVGDLQPDALRSGHDPDRRRSRSASRARPRSRRRPAAAATPKLKELVTVTSEVVRIGDLVEQRRRRGERADLPRARPRPDRLRAGAAHRRGAPPARSRRPRHRRPERGRGDAAVPRHHQQGHRRADRARGRRPVRLRRGAEHLGHLRPRHPRDACRGDRHRRLDGHADERRSAHRALRHRVRAPRQRHVAPPAAALHRHRARNGRGRDADAAAAPGRGHQGLRRDHRAPPQGRGRHRRRVARAGDRHGGAPADARGPGRCA